MVSNPITSFGVYQATIKDLVTHDMFQILILGSVEPDLTQDLVELRGGGAAFPWAAAPGEAKGEIKMTIKQYDAGVLKYFSPWETGSISESSSGEVAGNITTPVNAIGTSVYKATTGIASITVDPASRLKFGDYIVKAASATTVDIYVNTDIDDLSYVDDNLKITSAPISITTAGNTDSNGLRFVGGSGTIGMTTGDIMTFSVRPITSYMMQHQIGRMGAAPREFELTVVAEKIGSKVRVVRFPKVISSGGAALKFLYKDWATFDATIKILQDPAAGYAGLETFLNR